MARTETINPRAVLVVDDEHDILMLLKLILETHGYRALLARGAMEALQLLGQDDLELDLLLTDVVMPGMDGMDLARTCRELRPGLPVLFMSGFVDTEVVRLKIWDDGVCFLRKPFTEETIVDPVCELLGAVPFAHLQATKSEGGVCELGPASQERVAQFFIFNDLPEEQRGCRYA